MFDVSGLSEHSINIEMLQRNLIDLTPRGPVNTQYGLEEEIRYARALMSEVLPDKRDRAIVLRQLIESVEFVDSIAPDAWAVTLAERYFRLNVGNVEAFAYGFYSENVHMLLGGANGTPPFVGENFCESHYTNGPHPQCFFDGSLAEFIEFQHLIQEPHRTFVHGAATTKSGKPRAGSRFRDSHCEGLIAYARNFLASLEKDTRTEGSESDSGEFFEGGQRANLATRYERDRDARTECINHYGARCVVCDFNFGEVYGKHAEGFIHVHHLTPLSESEGQPYKVAPIEDLRPVCANCHAVIHLRTPIFSIDEVKAMMRKT